MDVMHREVTFVGCGRVVTVGDIEDVVRNILFNDEPGATGKAHTLALTDGMEPETTVFTDATTRLKFNDLTRVFTKVTTDIIIVVDLTQKTDARCSRSAICRTSSFT